MSQVQEFLKRQHVACDELLVAAESKALAGDWNETGLLFEQFASGLEHHLVIEEEVLFPAIEAAMGAPEGPTQVMRMDHEQMRALIAPLRTALESQDGDRFSGLAQSLLVLIQQHNMKEEQVLYPMADQVLASPGDVVAEMAARESG